MSLSIQLHSLISQHKPQEISGELDISHIIKERSEIISADAMQVEALAEFSAGLLEVKGQAKVNITFSCSRCLTSYDAVLKFPIRLAYTKEKQIAEADRAESIVLLKEDVLDLTPALEEELQLELPFVPVCGEDCSGLCPACGINLNKESCNCTVEKIDPRLEGLKDFFNK